MMDVIYKKAGQGKTCEAIRLSHEKDYYIVAIDHDECFRITEFAREEMGLPINFPLTFDEFLQGRYNGKGVKGLIIDNVDLLMSHISNAPVEMITLNKEE